MSRRTEPSTRLLDPQPPQPHPPQPRQPHRGGNTKRTGELSEAAFLLKATSLGFVVTSPWGDSERYDFILDSGSRLWRVQVEALCGRERSGSPQPKSRASEGSYRIRPRPRLRHPTHLHRPHPQSPLHPRRHRPPRRPHRPPRHLVPPPHRRLHPRQKPPLLPRHSLQTRPLRALPRSLAPAENVGAGVTARAPSPCTDAINPRHPDRSPSNATAKWRDLLSPDQMPSFERARLQPRRTRSLQLVI